MSDGDGGDPGLSLNSTTQVVVSVQDVNDNSPEFLERYYKIDILEAVVDEDEAFLQNDQQGLNSMHFRILMKMFTKKALKMLQKKFSQSVVSTCRILNFCQYFHDIVY